MKAFAPLLLLLALLAPPAAAAEPLLTPERTATLARLHRDKHPWADFAQGIATGSFGANPYGGAHQWQTLLWKMTGERAHARAAIESILRSVREARETANRNSTREASFYFALEYSWLRGEMTAAEQSEYEAFLRQWALSMVGRGNRGIFTLKEDSDEVVGHYFGLRLIDQALGSDYARQPAGPDSIDGPMMRQRIKDFCAQAEGGEWIESSEYNLGTLQLLLIGSAAVGLDEFPEVRALLPQIAEQLRWHVTSDLKESVQWGDEQEPHSLHLNQRVALMAIVRGMGGDADGELAKLLAALTRERPIYPHYWFQLYRALWFFDPSTLPSTPPVAPQGLRVSRGVGLGIFRTGDQLLQVHMQPLPSSYVDHTVAYFGDVRWYAGGEWVLDHPLGYGPGAQAHNVGLLAGLGSLHDRAIVSAEKTPGGMKIVGRTKGPRHVDEKYWNPPPAFADWTREVEFNGSLRVVDRFAGRPPGADDNYYPQEKADIQAALALWSQVWHAPVEPTATADGFTWQTKGGQKITLKTTATRRTKRPDEWGVTLQGNFHPDQRTGWQILLLSDEPEETIATTITLGDAPPPVPDPPPETPEQPRIYRLGPLELRSFEDRLELSGSIPRAE